MVKQNTQCLDQTGDGTSDATAVYGVDDILEAVYRNSSSVDSPLTKINRSTYQGLSNKTSEGNAFTILRTKIYR
jgi:hypothetical protein